MQSDSSAAFEKGMPAAPEYEDVLLGDCMKTDSTLGVATALLEETDFNTLSRKKIWKAITILASEGANPDTTMVYRYLLDEGTLESVGGSATLLDLFQFRLTENTAERYCRKLKQKSAQRQAITFASEIATGNVDRNDDEELASRFEAAAVALRSRQDRGTQAKRPSEVISESGGIDSFFGAQAVPAVRLPWREPLGGLRRGEMTVLAARPGVGKSAAASHLAISAAFDEERVHFWSLEMAGTPILRRMVAAIANIRMGDFHGNSVSVEERYRVSGMIDRLGRTLAIMDSSKVSVQEIEKQIEIEHKQGNCPSLVVIDYLQLMDGPGENRNNQISKITRGLKKLTLKYPVAILALAQLSRDSEKQSGRDPGLHDLRDSGSIEQDADNVVFLHPASADADASVQEIKWIVKKHRNGTTGSVALVFNKSLMQWGNM